MIISFKQALALMELQPTYTQEDLKRQYRKLAHKHHPDKGGSAEKFKQIATAYHFLKQYQPKPAPFTGAVNITFYGDSGGFGMVYRF